MNTEQELSVEQSGNFDTGVSVRPLKEKHEVAIMQVENEDYPNLGKEYANYGFCTWRQDGQRFLEIPFLSEYAKTGVAPVLKDGRPNIELWLNCTLSHDTFFSGWGWEARSEFAKPFLERMLTIFQEWNIGQDGTPSRINLIEAIICAIDESEFISRI